MYWSLFIYSWKSRYCTVTALGTGPDGAANHGSCTPVTTSLIQIAAFPLSASVVFFITFLLILTYKYSLHLELILTYMSEALAFSFWFLKIHLILLTAVKCHLYYTLISLKYLVSFLFICLFLNHNQIIVALNQYS